jgi:hypothetical protein
MLCADSERGHRMAHANQVVVHNEAHLSSVIDGYVMQGFAVASRDAASVTMVKRKTFNVVWAVIGFFLCLLPLLIYLIVYSLEQDQVVFIRLAAPPALTGGPPPLSPDRRYWWDGSAWQDASATPPPGAQRSPDGTMWWDGVEWRRPSPPASDAGAASP